MYNDVGTDFNEKTQIKGTLLRHCEASNFSTDFEQD